MRIALPPSSVRIRFIEEGILSSFTWLTTCVDRHDPNGMVPSLSLSPLFLLARKTHAKLAM